MIVVLAAVAAATAAFAVAGAATRTLGWAVASAVVAALIEPLVGLLDIRLPRFVAIFMALFTVGVVGVGVAGGVLNDLDQQFDRLVVEAPRAAVEIEQSTRFGELARDFRLEDRVGELLERVQDPTSGLAAEAPARTSTFFLCAILTAFFLSWGPRLGRAAMAQVTDEHRKERIQHVFLTGFTRARRYVLASVGRAAVAGGVAWGLCRMQDVPAAAVLGLTVGALTVVPGFGIVVGSLPALLLEAGLGSADGVSVLVVAFVTLQLIDEVILRRVVAPRSFVAGPAAIVIALVVGFEVYGVGGAFYGAALAVLGVALLDAAGEREPEPVDGDVRRDATPTRAATTAAPAGS